MVQYERYGNRDGERAYSLFHRVNSAQRWMSYDDAVKVATINIDRPLWIECHSKTFQPIALIETAIDIGQTRKPTMATVNLAIRANVLAFLVLYTLGDKKDSVYGDWEITQFRVKQLWPANKPFKVCTPGEYLQGLLKLRKISVERIVEEARLGDGQKRNHDAQRLRRRIENVSKQMELW